MSKRPGGSWSGVATGLDVTFFGLLVETILIAAGLVTATLPGGAAYLGSDSGQTLFGGAMAVTALVMALAMIPLMRAPDGGYLWFTARVAASGFLFLGLSNLRPMKLSYVVIGAIANLLAHLMLTLFMLSLSKKLEDSRLNATVRHLTWFVPLASLIAGAAGIITVQNRTSIAGAGLGMLGIAMMIAMLIWTAVGTRIAARTSARAAASDRQR